MHPESALLTYYEIALVDHLLKARLGAGEAQEIIEYWKTDPSIRVCFREPSDDTVRFRARFGIAILTESGPMPLPQEDATQRKGAWVGTLPIAMRVVAMLQNPEVSSLCIRAISEDSSVGWLRVEVSASRIETTSNAAIQLELAADLGPDILKHAFVRVGGKHAQVATLLRLLRKQDLKD